MRKIDEPFEPSKVDDILSLAEAMVAERRAAGWTQEDFANALKDLLPQYQPTTFELLETETVLGPEASARFKEIMEKGLAKPKFIPKALPTSDE